MRRIGGTRTSAMLAVLTAFAAFLVSCGEDKIVASGDFEVQRFADLPACNAAYEGLLANVKSWDADYFCNGEIWVLRNEKPTECDSSGILTDRRDGNTYRCADWGHGVWMVDNLDLGKFEHGRQDSATIWPEVRKQCWNENPDCFWGALYTWTDALLIDEAYDRESARGVLVLPHRGLCPMGWHVPTTEEFKGAYNDNEALERFWPNLKDLELVDIFQSEAWTVDGDLCAKKLSNVQNAETKTEWGEVLCDSVDYVKSRHLRCVQD